ncbi:MAG TPA: Hsp20/alpha crystallin family protein [Casimicrobiaceae bacterium]|nr:Hsp20/alpha crystallin family protein [Casimicrobiaceae bacterium]
MTALQVYGPFADANFEDIVRSFWKPLRDTRDAAAPIKVDVVESNDAFVVKAEVPGVAKDDIHVTIEGNQVTIAAEVKRESEKKDGERVLRSERYYGAVYRSFVLPVEIDENASNAKYEGGVLELTLTKKPAVSGRKLSIQ